MRCAACGAINDRGRAYCGYCAHRLGDTCPVCQFLNGEGVRYCGGCARDLLVVAAEPLVTPTVSPSATGERRELTSALEDLADLTGGIVPGGSAEQPPSGTADATQSDVDGFFQRLAREGGVEVRHPSTPGKSPGTSRSAQS